MTLHETFESPDLVAARADLAIAEDALADLAAYLAQGARPWFEAEGQPVREEQTIQHRAGVLVTDLAAARAMVARAGIGGAVAETAAARLLAAEAAQKATRFLFEAGGTSTTDDPRDFGRHWRAAVANAATSPPAEARLAVARARLDRPELSASAVAPVFSEPPRGLEDALGRADAVAAYLLHGAAERDRERRFPTAELRTFAASGLLAVSVPERFGGLGLTLADALEVCRRIGRGDSSIAQILTIHFSLLEALLRTGSRAQLARWLPRVAAGGRVGNAAAERGVAHAKVTATRLSGDPESGYRLDGRKFYSTGALGADLIFILAVDDAGQLASVVVEAGAPGLALVDDWHGLGQRSTGSGTTILQQVPVESDEILPRWLDADAPGTGTAGANLAHVPIDLGIAAGALSDLAATIRNQAGSVGTATLERFGRLSARLDAAEALFAQALGRLRALEGRPLTLEETQGFSLEVSIVKVFAGELALDIAEELLETAGPAALDSALGLGRHWRNARTHTLHDPSRWRYLRIGAHALTGRLPPRNRSN